MPHLADAALHATARNVPSMSWAAPARVPQGAEADSGCRDGQDGLVAFISNLVHHGVRWRRVIDAPQSEGWHAMTTTSEKERLDQARHARVSATDLLQLLNEASVAEWKIVVASPTGDRALVVPRTALERFAEVLAALGDGNSPSVVPMATELSTGELAELLGVSRQYAVRLLDDGRLPSRRVGNRRRVALDDALTYLRCDDKRRQESLRDLAASLTS